MKAARKAARFGNPVGTAVDSQWVRYKPLQGEEDESQEGYYAEEINGVFANEEALVPEEAPYENEASKVEHHPASDLWRSKTTEHDSVPTQTLDLNKTYVNLAQSQITVVIPTLNEEHAIGRLLDEVSATGFRDVLVVDGYSSDKTTNIAHEKGAKVIFQHGAGKAGAVLTAIEHVDTPYILFMDGDCTYDPKDIWRLLSHADRYAHVIGARDKRAISRVHRLGNWIISQTFSLLFGVNLSDVCSGMYLIETEAAKAYRLRETGFRVEIELAASSAVEDEVAEVPIQYRSRVGKAKLKAWYGIPILLAAFKLFRRFNPILLYSGIGTLCLIPAMAILAWVAIEQLTLSVWHSGWAIVGLVVLLASLQSFTLATMSILTRHSEERLMHQIKRMMKRTP